MISVAMFNNKGGVGKTTLTYHLAHMIARMGTWVLAVDLDPQANLTAALLTEDELAVLWHEPQSPAWHDGRDPAAIRTSTAFYRIIASAARTVDAELVFIDVGPNLGAVNRAALLAADTVVMPLADLFSLRGLQNLGPTTPLSHDARKPMFDLRTADGAIGSMQTLVQRCYGDFRDLAGKILDRLDLEVPDQRSAG